MTERKEVKVTDRRRGAEAPPPVGASQNPGDGDPENSSNAPPGTDTTAQHDYLGDLQRLQAEFENYRKRMMKEQADTSVRAKARLIESLLPVLDNFERAISHGEGGEGVALVFKDLQETLASEGLQEVPGEGSQFDPTVHEAVESREDPDVTDIVVKTVYRRGYRLGDQLLRAAMVVVSGPPEEVNGE